MLVNSRYQLIFGDYCKEIAEIPIINKPMYTIVTPREHHSYYDSLIANQITLSTLSYKKVGRHKKTILILFSLTLFSYFCTSNSPKKFDKLACFVEILLTLHNNIDKHASVFVFSLMNLGNSFMIEKTSMSNVYIYVYLLL